MARPLCCLLLTALLPLSAMARPAPASLPPLVLPLAAPIITATLAGKPVRLRVDPGGEDYVALTPEALRRLDLAADWPRPDGKPPRRGTINLAIGQLRTHIAYSVETLVIAGRARALRVVDRREAVAGDQDIDGEIGVPALPHDDVVLQDAPVAAGDWQSFPAHWGNGQGSDTAYFEWPLGDSHLDIELHPHRQTSIASVAAASRLVAVAGGKLTGPQRQAMVTLGYTRPVRTLQLARPLAIAGRPLASLDVRLFDWSGKADLPPDGDEAAVLTVTARNSRQRGWPLLRLGQDVLAGCHGLAFHRQQQTIALACPTR